MSFPPYSKYKDSGVEWLGMVPEHWRILPLIGCAEECVEPNEGMVENNLLSLSYGRIVRKDIESNDGLLPDSFETYQVVRPGDIVLRLTDLQNDKRSLRSALVEETGIITSAYLAIRPTGIDSRFLGYLLRAYDTTKVFYSMGGGLRQSMKFADMKRMPLLLPPIEEQRDIAGFLGAETAKIDALVKEQRRLIELLKEKRQAVISHAVTRGLNPRAPMKPSGVEWLGEVPKHWGVLPLKRDLEFITSGSRGWAENYSDEGDLFLRITNLTRDSIELDMSDAQRVEVPTGTEGLRTRVRTGDLLFSITADLGSVAVVPLSLEKAYVSQHIALTRLRQIFTEPKWVGYVALSSAGKAWFESESYGGTKIQLSLDDVRNLPIPVPPKYEQREITAFIERCLSIFNPLITEAQRFVDVLLERRAAIISAAVRGHFDVRRFDEKVPA